MKKLVTLLALLVVTACQRSAPSESPDAVLQRATEIYTADGPKPAIPEFRRALALFRAAKDRRGEAISLGRLGNATKAAGDVEAGIRLLTEALAIHREMKNAVEEGKTLNNLGLAHYTAGNYSEARKLLDDALAIARRIGEPRLEAASLNNSGMVLDELGDYRGFAQPLRARARAE